MIMGVLLLQATLCLLVLSVPPLLLCRTAYVAWQKGAFRNMKAYVVLNTLLAVAVVLMVVGLRIGTLNALALVSYFIVFGLMVVFGCVMMLSLTVKRARAGLRRRRPTRLE
jgi:hypothetical protein